MMYVSKHPERCEGLFLMSPGGSVNTEAEGFEYDPYSVRIDCDSDKLPTRCFVNSQIKIFENADHVFGGFIHRRAPYCLVKAAIGMKLRKIIPSKHFTEGYIEGSIRYWSLMTQRLGKQDQVLLKCLRWNNFMKNNLVTEKKMLQDFVFPIAFTFGTRDFFGSDEGADTIVKRNRFYKTGQSQLFKQKNSGHNVFLDDPN